MNNKTKMLSIKYTKKAVTFPTRNQSFCPKRQSQLRWKIHSLILKYIIEKRFCLLSEKEQKSFPLNFPRAQTPQNFQSLIRNNFLGLLFILQNILQQLPTNLTLVSWFSLQLNATHLTRTFFSRKLFKHTHGWCLLLLQSLWN